jgi:hypothetical protein
VGVTLGVDPRHLLIYTHSMEILVDLPAPSCKGTYIALVEPNVVKIGTSNCISKRLTGIRTSTFRRVALLAWTNTPEYNVHELFDADRITISREFFRVSDNLITFINDCRVALGFQEIEEVLLWEFGGPLPYREELNIPQGVASSKISEPVSPEDRVRRGKYYTHLRWHKNKPKPSCEFCTQSVGSQ